MKWLKFLLVLCFLFFGLETARALDWQKLHQEAGLDNLQQAEDFFRNNPESLEGQYVLGLVYLNRHRDQEANQIFSGMLELNPDLIGPQWGQAEVLRREAKFLASEKILRELIETDPDFSPAYISLAYIKYTQLDFKQAVKLARKVIRQGQDSVDLPNYTRAYLINGGSRGMLAYYGGPLAKIRYGTSVFPNLKKAQKLMPKSPAVLFGLGSFYFLSPKIIGGNLDKAQKYLQETIAIDPQFADAYVRLAQVYKAKGDSAKYDLYMQQALSIDPDNILASDEQSGECKFICLSVKE
ncbi:tetratricopeptide repeat protein [Candidatus Omnitrophota bacterium]